MNIRYPIYEGVYRILTLKPGSTIGYRSSRQGMFLAPPTSACAHQPGKDHSGYSFPDCADQ